jgi:hypothetical protein
LATFDLEVLRAPAAARLGNHDAQLLRQLWPDRDESTRAAVDAVLAARAERIWNAESVP